MRRVMLGSLLWAMLSGATVRCSGGSFHDDEDADRLNAAIAEGRVKNRDGTVLEAKLDEALVTDDGKLLYPVSDGIPVCSKENRSVWNSWMRREPRVVGHGPRMYHRILMFGLFPA